MFSRRVKPNPDALYLTLFPLSFVQLERFLIDNRDDYLKYSSRNYTVEQKQFNNLLTERLIELAEKHSYIFDPEEFNFVAIRDRIRCYYKSYVQTARKRGLLLPTDKRLITIVNVLPIRISGRTQRCDLTEPIPIHISTAATEM